MEDYKRTIELNATAEKVFDALRNKIPFWWTEMFEGSSNQADSIFTVRFGEEIFKTMKVVEIAPNSGISWHVTDSLIGIPELQHQTEWINTTIVWEIQPKADTTYVLLKHIGLVSQLECYEICTDGWQRFTDSLRSYVQSGKGYPFRGVREE